MMNLGKRPYSSLLVELATSTEIDFGLFYVFRGQDIYHEEHVRNQTVS